MPNTRFLVYSEGAVKGAISRIPKDSSFIWIQVKTMPSDLFLDPPSYHKGFKGKLNLSFFDTTLETHPNVFSQTQTQNVVEFTYKHLPVDYIVVNCEAGISRSAGIAVGLEESLFQRNSTVRDQKPNFNVVVSNRIKRYVSTGGI